MAKPTITTRAGKGSALTWTEGDANLTNLRDATIAIKAGSAGTDVVSDLNGTITLVAGTNVTLSGNNSTKEITINASGGSGITDVVQDTTPQLGGDLDVNGKNIVSASNGNIAIVPNGTGNIQLTPTSGKIILGALDFPTSMGSNGQVLTTNGSSAMSWTTVSSGATNLDGLSDVVITAAANGKLLQHNGTNWVDVNASSVNVGSADSATLATTATKANNLANGSLGSLPYQSAANTTSLLSPNTTTTQKFLTQVGDGTNSMAPMWSTISTLDNVIIGSTGAAAGSFTTLSATTTATTQALNITYNPATASGQAVTLTGKDSQGGVGYFDFLKITNTTTGATNPNKTFRVNSTGQFEIVDSTYTNVRLALTDAGALQVGGTTFPTATGTTGQVLTLSSAGQAAWSTPSSSGGMNCAIVTMGSVAQVVGATNYTYRTQFTEVIDPGNFLSLADTNYRLVLGAGTYVVFTDSVVHAIAEAQPSTLHQLYNVTNTTAVLDDFVTNRAITTNTYWYYPSKPTKFTLSATGNIEYRFYRSNTFYTSQFLPRFYIFKIA